MQEPRPAFFVPLSDITDKHAIPDRFLVQILLQLKTVGLVTTTRGKAGGYQLARSPEQITLTDIVGALDGMGEPLSGRIRPPRCEIRPTLPREAVKKGRIRPFGAVSGQREVAVRVCSAGLGRG